MFLTVLGSSSSSHQVWDSVPKLVVELGDKALDEPIAVYRLFNNLLHRLCYGQEILVVFPLQPVIPFYVESDQKGFCTSLWFQSDE